MPNEEMEKEKNVIVRFNNFKMNGGIWKWNKEIINK